jgi:hypothetical protein
MRGATDGRTTLVRLLALAVVSGVALVGVQRAARRNKHRQVCWRGAGRHRANRTRRLCLEFWRVPLVAIFGRANVAERQNAVTSRVSNLNSVLFAVTYGTAVAGRFT